jgi:hypothetical protein
MAEMVDDGMGASTPSRKLNYGKLTDILNDLSKKIRIDLNYINGKGNGFFSCNSNITLDADKYPNFYININLNGEKVGHISFHFGKSRTKDGSTHFINDLNGNVNRILINLKNEFIFERPSTSIIEESVLYILNQQKDELLRTEDRIIAEAQMGGFINDSSQEYYKLKYLKYKKKYIELKN